MQRRMLFGPLLLLSMVLGACIPVTAPAAAPTPTVDPAIYNQVPDTTLYEAGECVATLAAPTPAHTSNTLGGPPSAEIAPGEYSVAMTADYGSSLWLMLGEVAAPANWINSNSVTALSGACAANDSPE